MVILLAASIVIFCTLILALSPYGPQAAGLVFLLGTVLVGPFTLVGKSGIPHVGISGALPALSTFTVGVLLALIMQRWKNTRLAWTLVAPGGIWIGVGTFAFWGGSGEVIAGAALLATGLLAFIVGVSFGVNFDRDSRPAFLLSSVLCLLVLSQVLIALLQQAGIDVFSVATGRGEAFQTGRVSGTLGHANNLGKAMVLAIMIALPLTRSAVHGSRRFALLTVLLAFVALGLSQGRANGVAAIVMIALWATLTPRALVGTRRWLLPVLVGGVAIAFIGPIVDRFNADPAGGAREHFTEVALREIPNHLFLGVGPNAYVTVIGRMDRLTAEGWPVHNTFLLGIAEWGVVGALLLFLPWLYTTVRAASALRRLGADGDFARVHVSALPGILAILTTGWGMLQQSNFVYWMLVTGMILGQVRRSEHGVVEPRRLTEDINPVVSGHLGRAWKGV